MRVLRENKESIIAVLEAFVHDPLINWRLVQGGRQVGHQNGQGGQNAPAGARRPRGDETNIHDGASLAQCSCEPPLTPPLQMGPSVRSTHVQCRSSSVCSRSSLAATSSRPSSSRSMPRSTLSLHKRLHWSISVRCLSAGARSGANSVPSWCSERLLTSLLSQVMHPAFVPLDPYLAVLCCLSVLHSVSTTLDVPEFIPSQRCCSFEPYVLLRSKSRPDCQ